MWTFFYNFINEEGREYMNNYIVFHKCINSIFTHIIEVYRDICVKRNSCGGNGTILGMTSKNGG